MRPSDAGHPLAPADFLDLRRECRSFEGLAAMRLFGIVRPDAASLALFSAGLVTVALLAAWAPARRAAALDPVAALRSE